MTKRILLLLLLLSVLMYTGCGGGGGGKTPPVSTGSVSGKVTSVGELSTTILQPSQSFPKVEVSRNNSFRSASIHNEKIIRFRDDINPSDIEQIVQSMGGKIKKKVYGPHNTYVITLTTSYFKSSAFQDNNIVYIEDNIYWYAFSLSPNDTYYEDYQKWHYSMMFLPEAWAIQQGNSSVVVAVIDSGVYPHSDLNDNLVTTNTWDFVDDDSNPTDIDWDGINGHHFSHGTHVAGIISARTNNNFGIAGVGWNVKIMPIRVLGPNGQGDLADVASGIYWAVNNGAKVINLSLGGSGTITTITEAIAYAEANNVTVVAAAGNESGPVSYPAKYETVIAVSALDHTGSLASYSNYGPEIDVCAPGGAAPIIDPQTQSILSTTYNKQTQEEDWVFMSGTSMAAPHIAGLVALLYSQNINITPSEVRERLRKFVVDKGALNKDNYYGYGMPNSYAVLNNGFNQIHETKVFVYRRETDTITAFNYPNSSGNYTISKIQPGNYSICAFLDKNMNGIVDTDDKFGYVENVTINAGIVTENIDIELISPQQTRITIEEYLANILP